jgi:primosomal protein N' (replication factor Y)
MTIAKIAVSAATFAIDKPYSYAVPPELSTDLAPGMRVMVPFGKGNKRVEGMVLALAQEEGTQKLKPMLSLLDERPVLDEKGVQLALWLRDRCFCTVYTAVLSMLPTGLWYTLKDNYRLAPGVEREEAFRIADKSPKTHRLLELLYASGGQGELGQFLAAFEGKDPKPILNELVREGILLLETGARRKIGDKTERIAILSLPPQEAMALVEKRRESAPMRYAVTQLLCAIGSGSVKEISYFTGASGSTLKSLEKSGILRLEEQEVFRRALPGSTEPPPPLILNEEQEEAVRGLGALLRREKPEAALLYGVTGSGKTQIYLSLIQEALAMGRTALVLVPEIALTTKLLELFTAYFGRAVAILHSGLPTGERYDEWKRIRDGRARVVLGTRSAVFAPLDNLGLVILDEEQEASYRSEHMLRYHARDVAKYRCSQHKALLVLGSATPAIETMFAAREDSYHLFTLHRRYNEKALPGVVIADMKEELRRGNQSGLSRPLLEELEQNLRRGEQSILFLNRRGTSRMAACGECGQAPACPRCSVYLTYHGANQRMMCHYCGYSEKLPERCPSCGGGLHFIGLGTQRIEAELKSRYHDVEIMRMDTDAVSAAQSHEAILERFQRKRVPILLGTQMVAKGLDFENVTLVGVIAADLSLYADHFRASERTFSLLTQVVGRAGRGDKPGRAVIQTFTPDNEIITLAARQDYDSFYEEELAIRRLRRFPPYSDLFRLTVSGPDEAAVLRVCMNLRRSLELLLLGRERGAQPHEVLGPAPAGIVKVNNRYRYQLTLNGQNTKELRLALAHLLRMAQQDPATRGITMTGEFNPMD